MYVHINKVWILNQIYETYFYAYLHVHIYGVGIYVYK